jgi:ribosomal protein S18 acetylase RimI-like enzyme
VSGLHTIQLGDERMRVGPWRGDTSIAHLVPLPDSRRVTASGVRRCVHQLHAAGYERALTAALGREEQQPFLDAGFTVHERLHLLAHDLADLPSGTPATLRRARSADRGAVLAVDEAAFPSFWRLDGAAVDDAVRATPQSRFRVALDGARVVIGYAITGRAGVRGYLQRLAVDPVDQGKGTGTALVVDGLRWLRRRGAREVLVNTQAGNDRAVTLYEHLGFRHRPHGLAVLALDLTQQQCAD